MVTVKVCPSTTVIVVEAGITRVSMIGVGVMVMVKVLVMVWTTGLPSTVTVVTTVVLVNSWLSGRGERVVVSVTVLPSDTVTF